MKAGIVFFDNLDDAWNACRSSLFPSFCFPLRASLAAAFLNVVLILTSGGRNLFFRSFVINYHVCRMSDGRWKAPE